MNRRTLDFLELINGTKKGWLPTALRGLLCGLSVLFSGIVFSRKWLYRKGLLRTFHPKAFTISVGNLVAGGTGKTPFAIFLAEHFASVIPTAVVLGGYKARASRFPVVMQPGTSPDVAHVGDEACLVARGVPHALLAVGKKRLAAKLADDAGARCLIVDDGAQHLALARDVNIVLIDAKTPFSNGYLLPRGLLREPPSALATADLVVLSRYDGSDMRELVGRYTQAPCIGMQLAFEGIYDLQDRPVPDMGNRNVGLFCGIAQPASFQHFVEHQGHRVVDTLFFPDHEGAPDDTLRQFANMCRQKGASSLLVTEKDRVRLSSCLVLDLPVYWVKVGVRISPGKELFEQLLASWRTRACTHTARASMQDD